MIVPEINVEGMRVNRHSLLIGWMVLTSGIAAQVPAAPQFEVAAIKPAASDELYTIAPGILHGRFQGHNVSLRQVLGTAYGFSIRRVIGPDWLDNRKYDFEARSPEGVPDQQVKLMLQALLKERFHLVAHLETKEMPVYDLVVAKGGVKMAVYPAEPRMPQDVQTRGYPAMRGTATTFQLADHLSGSVERTVVDKTGLKDRYNFFLSFRAPGPGTAEATTSEIAPPDVFLAVREQLGLELVPDKANIAVVVVDRMDQMPTEN